MRLGFAYQKSGFHVDESLSIAISSHAGIAKMQDGQYFGEQIKQEAYFNDNSIKDLLHDLKELWKNNYGDGAAHPNLYYTLLRIWSFDIKSGDFSWLKSRGIGLNLVFFAFGFYAMFILGIKIFSRHSFLVPLFLAFIFWNSASVTNTIFVRPYALQEMLLLVFALNCFVFYKLHFTSAKEIFKKYKLFFVWFIFATALLCLSHYFSLFFIAFTFIFIAFISRKNIFPLSVVVVSSFAITQILYLGYFSSLFGGYRAKESAEKLLLGNFWQNLNQTFNAGADIINAHFCNVYGFVVLLVACGIALFIARKQIKFKMPNFALLSNLKAFFAYFKPIAKNTLKIYKKIFIALSILVIFAYIVAFVLIVLAKDNIQNASIYLDSIKYSKLEPLTYTAKIAYKHIIFNARSKMVSNLIVENIVWDNALDSNTLTIKQIKNRYIDFSITQDLILDSMVKQQLGVLSYHVDFTPLLKVVFKYYIVLLILGFIITLYVQYAKIAWNEVFMKESIDSTQASKSNAIFLLGFFMVGAVWFCFIFFIAPFKDLRYVMPIFPFLCFGVMLLLVLTKKSLLQSTLGIAFVVSLFANYNVQYLYKQLSFIFTQNPKIPVLVHLPNFSWQQGAFLFAFNDTQIYIADSNIERLKDRMHEFDWFYLISEYDIDSLDGYKQIALQKDWYGHFYELKKEVKLTN